MDNKTINTSTEWKEAVLNTLGFEWPNMQWEDYDYGVVPAEVDSDTACMRLSTQVDLCSPYADTQLQGEPTVEALPLVPPHHINDTLLF